MYIWDDQEIALREVSQHYASTKERYSLDEENVVLAGFSMGGETALRAALTGTVPARGFILLGPGGPTIDNPSEWLPLLEAREQKLRGYILLGEEDHAIQSEPVLALVGLLNERGIPCKLETIPGLVHDYPRNSPEYIERALSFIAPRQAT
jgi:dienelactone hydrolase